MDVTFESLHEEMDVSGAFLAYLDMVLSFWGMLTRASGDIGVVSVRTRWRHGC